MGIDSINITGMITQIEDITEDIRILHVKPNADFSFSAGQYVELSIDGQDPRYFSIASAPQDKHLEFHIRYSGYGLSAYLFSDRAPQTELTITGPLGKGVPEHAARPLLLLAGGIGIAPMISVVKDRLHKNKNADIHLYWGVRDEKQLYMNETFQQLAETSPNFRYTPLVSDEDSDIRRGFAGDAATKDYNTLENHSIYIAGPKAMIEATQPLLLEKKADDGYVFQDIFSV